MPRRKEKQEITNAATFPNRRNTTDDDDEESDLRDVNPIFGCLIPCLMCCIYPYRAFFLVGRHIFRRKSKNKRFQTTNDRRMVVEEHFQQLNCCVCNCQCTTKCNSAKLRSNLVKNQNNLQQYPETSLGNYSFSPEISNSNYAGIPLSNSYGPRRYVIDTIHRDKHDKNQFTHCSSGFDVEVERKSKIAQISSSKHHWHLSDIYSTDKGKSNINIKHNKEFINKKSRSENRRQVDFLPNCTSLAYSDTIILKYHQGICFVDE
ncbi:uncharacterized protein CMU_000340 [Cryptosporidium muris RN66]|uniref:Uncharacterized protein n=1 Tax=Cryptosporidium muris (strain RN66) TaxID=441375 RepID=B6AG23_CRYMR|nr:uncharacterized protein CMU_000340 [Cryptosporidium muris RN66]EEA07164.1 hypothetical protein, conserved [Cryptosporidium muris RN66]|eukprot:XP_002141513.1 hypothetical protein [Cryptosporidium muris RN66]